jgi:hypothetical protein
MKLKLTDLIEKKGVKKKKINENLIIKSIKILIFFFQIF